MCIRDSLYVAESENCAVKELSNGEWTCFKIGLASDGEQSSFKILGDQRTGNSGDYDQVRNYPVKNVGRTEAVAHQIWRGEGYSTIKGMDSNVPDEFKLFFTRQRGGTEWFCAPRELLLNEMDLDFQYDGEMNIDTALDPALRDRILPSNRLAGEANVLIFAHADAASGVRNIIKMKAGGLEVGPILMGMKNKAHIVTPSITARGLLNMAAIAGTPVTEYE